MSKPRSTAILLLAVALATAGWMYYRTTQEQLWSYAPLALYLSLFGAYFLLRNFPSGQPARPDAWLPVATGALLGLGFPGILPVPLLTLVAFVPMFELAHRLNDRDAGLGEWFRHGFTAFLLYNILATYWVTNTGFFAGCFAVLANSVLMTLPWLFARRVLRLMPSYFFVGFAAAWLAFEFGHYRWELNWPWLTLGNAFAQWPSLVQWYELTGALGGSFWILLCNYLVYQLYFLGTRPDPEDEGWRAYRNRRLRNFGVALAAVVLLPLGGSLLRYATYAEPAGEEITVAAIQPNFEPHYEKFNDPLQTAPLDTFVVLSRAALAAGPVDYLVFPETSFRGVNELDPFSSQIVRTLSEELNGLGADYLFTGVSAIRKFAPGEEVSRAVRYSGDVAYEGVNGVLQLELGTNNFATYRKGLFVPGAESFPFRDFLPFMEPLVNSIGGTVAGLGTQPRRTALPGKRAVIAPVICYESVFGDYFGWYVKAGAQAAFVVTNDGWWDRTAGYRQHLWLSSLRAVETRRAVVRAANLGACAFIDQRGAIVSRTEYDEMGYLRGTVRLNDALTVYVRYGDYLGAIALGLFVVVFGLTFLPRFRQVE